MPKTKSGPRTLPVKAGNANRDAVIGEEARRLEFAHFVFEKRTLGETYDDIMVMLAETFLLDRVPSRATVINLFRQAVKYRTEKIGDMREQYLAVAIPRLEAIIKNFLPAATGNGPRFVLRHKMFDGTEVDVIDEDKLEEAKKAAEIILKTTEQARKLLGIGLVQDGGDGEAVTHGQINTLIFNTVQQNFTGPQAQRTIGDVKLIGGDPVIDALESGI